VGARLGLYLQVVETVKQGKKGVPTAQKAARLKTLLMQRSLTDPERLVARVFDFDGKF
jgi:hypothetical protein